MAFLRWFLIYVLFLWPGLKSDVWADLGLRDVRATHADVNGDGVAEVIVGGRLGAPLAVDVPRSARRAGVGVYRSDGALLHPICERSDLNVVADVAGGDVDGDGMDEVVVGMGALTVFDVIDNQLVVLEHVVLGNDWTDRVMVGDVDDDGRVEVVVTMYEVGPDAEVGRSVVMFWQWTNRGLMKKNDFVLEGHVGDLCVVKSRSDQSFVALEVGMGDEGGDVYLMSAHTGQTVWRGEMTDARMRALSLAAHKTQIVIGGVDGRVWFADVTAHGLMRQPVQRRLNRFSGVVWMSDALLFFGHTGLQRLRF